MRAANLTALILVVIGALNWLLVGLFSFDLVAWLFGPMSTVSRVIYTLVGIGGVWMLFTLVPQLATTHEWREAPASASA